MVRSTAAVCGHTYLQQRHTCWPSLSCCSCQDPRPAIVAGVGFGLGRAAMPIARAVDGTRGSWDAKLERCLPRIRAVVAVAGTLPVATLAHGTVS